MRPSGWRVPPGGKGSKAPFRAGARTYRPTRAGKMFSPRAQQDSAGEAGTIQPQATVSNRGTSTTARGPGKDLCPPGASAARGRLREPAQRRTLTSREASRKLAAGHSLCQPFLGRQMSQGRGASMR